MLKKTIKYNDFNGVEREDTFFFNLTKAEIAEMEMSVYGVLSESIKNIIAANDSKEIIKIFKELILKAYGEKTADGKRFRKTDDNGNSLGIAFSETEAYSNLFMELSSDDNAAIEFVNGIIPADIDKDTLQKEVDKIKNENE